MAKLPIKQLKGNDGTSGSILMTDGTKIIYSEDSTASVALPSGDTASRPTLTIADEGHTRFNTDTNLMETWDGSAWVSGSGINDLSDVTGGEPALTDGTPAIATWTLGTLKSDAIDQLNQVLGKLVPASPSSFPGGQTLTVASVGSTPLLASGVIPDNTSGGTLPVVAGNSVTRITAATVSSNTIGDNGSTGYDGPGDSGTVAAVVNGSTSGSVVLTTGSQNGTYTNLLIANDQAYPLATPGFWESFRASVTAASAIQGWNRIQITHSAASNTNTVYFVRDNLTALPTLASGTVANNTATPSYSSGVIHYGSITDNVDISSLTMTNIAGETYYGGSDVVTITGLAATSAITGKAYSHTGSVGSASNYNYASLGITTPVARQTTTATALDTLNFTLNSNNQHTMGYLGITGKNVNGTSTQFNITSPYILIKRGTAQATQIDENAIVGSSVNAARTYLGSGFTGDTPAGPLPTGAASWTSSQDLSGAGYLHEAAVVGGVLTRDLTNYTTGFLPTNTVNYSTKNASQYFTFVFTKSALSNFSMNITGTYSGLWIGLPGISDDNGQSPNALGGAWWNAFALYNGSGIPGRVGDVSAGCATGAVASGTTGSVAITFGAATSTLFVSVLLFLIL